jgi:hypothetical protein
VIFEDFWLKANGGSFDVDRKIDQDLVIGEMRFGDEREVKVILNIDFFLTGCRLQSLFLFISLFSLEFWVFKGFQESKIQARESTWEQSLNLDNLNVGHIKKIDCLSSLLLNFSGNFILSKGSVIT